MARSIRVEYAGAVYHVMARGQERGSIYRDEEDRRRFLSDLERVVSERRWLVHGYCLMTNHYHLLVETPEPNLSLGMRDLNGLYSQAFNLRHARKGHVFEGRYKAIVVEKESYLLELCRYVVLNPVRAGMVRAARDWRWSNYRATVGETERPRFLEVDWTIKCFGTAGPKARERYRQFVAEGKGASSPIAEVTGQVFLGGPEFLAQMRKLLEKEEFGKAFPREQRQVGFVGVAKVMSAVAQEYGMTEERLCEAWRKSASEARAVAIYLAKRLSGEPGTALGARFGVTGARAGQLAKNVAESAEPKVRRRVARLEERIRSGGG